MHPGHANTAKNSTPASTCGHQTLPNLLEKFATVATPFDKQNVTNNLLQNSPATFSYTSASIHSMGMTVI